MEIAVWRHRGGALDQGDAVAALLSAHLGIPSRLVRVPPDHQRRVNPEFFPGEAHTPFTDGYPLGVIFGQNLVHLGQGEVAVGDRVEVIESR